MIRQFLRDSFLYSLSALFVRGIGFLLLPLYTRALGVESYGLYDYITAIGSILGVIVALEVCQGVHRFVPEFSRSRLKRAYYISTALWFTYGCYGFVAVIVFFNSQFLAELLFHDKDKWRLVDISALVFFANANVYLITSTLRATLRPKHSTLISALYALCAAGFSLFFLFVLQWQIEALLVAQLISGAITSIAGFWLIRKSILFRVSMSALKKLLAFSIPLVPSSIGVIFALFADRVMIKEMLGFESVGVYGVAVRVASILTLLSVGFQYAITPLIYSRYKEPQTPANIAKLYHSYLVVAALLFLAVSLSATWIVSLVADEGFSGAANLIPILAAATIFASMHVFFPGLNLASKTGVISGINIAIAVANLGLNYVLIKHFGAVGAAYATFLTVFAGWLCISVFSQRYYRVPVNPIFIGGFFSLIIAFLLLS